MPSRYEYTVFRVWSPTFVDRMDWDVYDTVEDARWLKKTYEEDYPNQKFVVRRRKIGEWEDV